jgi:Tfp pilus assembly protein PilX
MYKSRQTGSILVSILIVMLFLTSLIYALLSYANSNLYRSKSRIYNLQAQYAAESAADQAIAYINNGNESYTGTTSDITLMTVGNMYKATYAVSVGPGATAKEKIITATGKVYTPANSVNPSFTRKVEVIAERTSSSTSTSMLSKNIIEVASSVKNVIAKDIFVNNYLRLNKNTTDLTAENITVADRDTSAGNCSIGGSGDLVKPGSFTDPAQTKTIIRTAFNNCLNPPGNSTNTDFEVYANLNTISKVTSTYIPWSQFMDNSYQNSPGGCTDWTTGAFPRDIPSTGNSKKTHYPDQSSGVASSCGTSGNLQLGSGQYNIRDHTHVRANMCTSSACTPLFNNPDATDIKFVFIEGRVNFDQITTTSGSGPIVFVIYGPDSGTRTNACPLGDSFYLGKSGSTSTNAPQFYAVANNGACFEGTKFAVSPAFGGISAKNIYIATNSGTPFDLRFNISFPTSSIPVDLSWKAVKYRRL